MITINKQAMSEEDRALIRSGLLSGAGIGTGVGLATVLANYLRSLKKDQELEDEGLMDNNTLYIQTPRSGMKKAGADSMLAPGLALSGGVLSGIGAHLLVRKVYEKIRREQLLKSLDEAQRETVDLVGLEGDLSKQAKDERRVGDMGFWESLQGFGGAAGILALLASGALTYKSLNKAFPVVKPPKATGPKRIRLVPQGEEEDDMEKDAAFLADHRDFEAAGDEFLITMVSHLPGKHNITRGLLNKVASEGLRKCEDILQKEGAAALLASTEKTQDIEVDGPLRAVAAMCISKSARLSPTARMIAASEYYDRHPNHYAIAIAGRDDEALTKLAHIGCIFGLQARFDNLADVVGRGPISKNASEGAILTALQAALAPGEETLSDTRGRQTEEDGSEEEVKPDDPVDAIIAGEEASPVADDERAEQPEEEEEEEYGEAVA